MKLDPTIALGLDLALNEATLLDAQYDPATNSFLMVIEVLAMTEEKTIPEDRRVAILLTSIHRVLASHYEHDLKGQPTRVIPFTIGEFSQVTRSLEGQAVYGWEFINCEDFSWPTLVTHPVLNFFPENARLSNLLCGISAQEMKEVIHTIDLFQETSYRNLEFRVWFETLRVFDMNGQEIDIHKLIANAKRWWDALHNNDPLTSTFGISPL